MLRVIIFKVKNVWLFGKVNRFSFGGRNFVKIVLLEMNIFLLYVFINDVV